MINQRFFPEYILICCLLNVFLKDVEGCTLTHPSFLWKEYTTCSKMFSARV